ncbi:MAG: J domain-containing protein [Chloroflexota bacterium]|nr:J domain-containing protein [Chloroflexota bacterium]
MSEDYYRLLGVEPHASAEAIHAAYRRLARLYHPDVNSAAAAALRMRAINAAYAVLRDPARRAAYDARRYLPRVQVAARHAYAQTGAGAAVRPRAKVARPASGPQRGVDRLVGIVGLLLLLGVGFYVVNLIPYAEQEYQAARRGTLPRSSVAAASDDHPVGGAPLRLRGDDGLRAFPNTVLVAPEGLEPFASLPVSRVDANGRGLARYAVYYGDWARGGATISGLVGRAAFDQAQPHLPDCQPDADYCVGPAPGQTTGAPGMELFRPAGLLHEHPAFATHRVCCNGVFWSLTWYEARANMTYTLDLSRTVAARYGSAIGADNLSAARTIATLAWHLTPLRDSGAGR